MSEGVAVLEQAGRAIAEVAAAVGPAVVGVGRRSPLGSGLVIDRDLVLTCAHNTPDRRRTVTFAGGRQAVGEVVGADVDGDLAVLQADTAGVTPVTWGDTGAFGIGSAVLGIANPGGRGLRVTFGFVSGTDRGFRGPRGRRIEGAIEHTAPLLPGSSGGPIVGLDGRVLGMNTNRLGDGFYLAIPTGDETRQRIDALAAGDEPTRLRLGVAVVPASVSGQMRAAVGLPDADGVLVRGVEPGSPAASAGVEKGDLITRVADQAITDVEDLYRALDDAVSSAELGLQLLRGTEAVELTVLVEEQ